MRYQKDRRAAPRYDLAGEVRFLLRGEEEGSGNLLNISECGLALTTESAAKEGDEVVVYPQDLGRMPGRIARAFDGGFCVAFEVSDSEREIIKDRIAAAIDGVQFLRLGQARSRSSSRVEYNISTEVRFENRSDPVKCVIMDMSQSGARIGCEETPEIGSHAVIGALHGLVVRHFDGGFAVEFVRSTTKPMKVSAGVDHIDDPQLLESNARQDVRCTSR